MRRFLKSATQKPGYEEYFEYMEFADQAKRIRNIDRAHAQNGEANQPTNDDRYKDKLIEANDYWKKRIKEVTDKISAYKKGDVVDEAKIKNLEERRDSLILQAALSFKRIERKYIGQQQ